MFPVELDRFICCVPVVELLKMFVQNLHIYHRNDSTSVCIIYFIYILVLENVIGSDVGGVFLAHTVCLVWSSSALSKPPRKLWCTSHGFIATEKT